LLLAKLVPNASNFLNPGKHRKSTSGVAQLMLHSRRYQVIGGNELTDLCEAFGINRVGVRDATAEDNQVRLKVVFEVG
jgi:hypothetical protein